MAALYGHAWVTNYGDDPSNEAARTWATALAGLTGAQLAEGLRCCVTEGREFPPSAPRFRAMCLGIPSFARVKLEVAGADVRRSPFTHFVWSFVDSYAHRTADIRSADRMLLAAYEIAAEARMQGAELPAPAVAEIGREGPEPFAPASPEIVAKAVAEVRELLDSAETSRTQDELVQSAS